MLNKNDSSVLHTSPHIIRIQILGTFPRQKTSFSKTLLRDVSPCPVLLRSRMTSGSIPLSAHHSKKQKAPPMNARIMQTILLNPSTLNYTTREGGRDMRSNNHEFKDNPLSATSEKMAHSSHKSTHTWAPLHIKNSPFYCNHLNFKLANSYFPL